MMKIRFHTKNLDTAFYRQLILQYIMDHITVSLPAYNKYRDFHEDWEIHIHPVEDWEGKMEGGANVGLTNDGIPHGVTGEGKVKVYVIDDSDKGLLALQNFSPIFHEIAHMLLLIIMRGKRGVFRNKDLSGNKPGSEANVSTQEVHDRMVEQNTYFVKTHVNFGNWLFKRWTSYTAVGLNLRDYIQKNA